MSLAAIHLREEPDALRSARPDPCGGQPATAVPTAIDNHRFRTASNPLAFIDLPVWQT
jgi:hypothetical protein